MFQDFMAKLLHELIEEETAQNQKNGNPAGNTPISPIEIPKIGSNYILEVEDLEITLSDQAPGLSLYVVIDTVGIQENLEEFYTTLLRGNFMGQATRKAALGLNEEGSKVILSHQTPAIKSYREFRDTVEDFINAACFWKSRVEESKNH